jgi:hypothetical protein
MLLPTWKVGLPKPISRCHRQPCSNPCNKPLIAYLNACCYLGRTSPLSSCAKKWHLISCSGMRSGGSADLQRQAQVLTPALQAALDFARGLNATAHQEALEHFQRSLHVWQTIPAEAPPQTTRQPHLELDCSFSTSGRPLTNCVSKQNSLTGKRQGALAAVRGNL